MEELVLEQKDLKFHDSTQGANRTSYVAEEQKRSFEEIL